MMVKKKFDVFQMKKVTNCKKKKIISVTPTVPLDELEVIYQNDKFDSIME